MEKFTPIFVLAFSLILTSSCSSSAPVKEIKELTPTPTLECSPTMPEEKPVRGAYETILEPLDLVAPSGNRIFGMIRRPDPAIYPDLCFPAVVMVPGGINPGRMAALGQDIRLLAGSGMVVLTFNAEGRADDSPDDIRSEGSEDYNGFRHQDGLCAIVRYVIDLPYVLPDNVGIASQSYGITMAAGCAARYPEIAIKYIVDGEGPPYSFATCHGPRFLAGELEKYQTVKGIFDRLAAWQDPSSENLDWWSEREAIHFIGSFRGYYLRLQAQWDHAQPPESAAEIARYHHPDGWPGGGPAWWHNKHTSDIVNAAVVGGVPWVRVNLPAQGNLVNATFDADHSPVFLPGYLAEQPWAVYAILEIANMPPDPSAP